MPSPVSCLPFLLLLSLARAWKKWISYAEEVQVIGLPSLLG